MEYGKGITVDVFNCLLKDFPDVQIIAISGRNPKVKELFETASIGCNRNALVKILEFTNKVPELMSISDLVVTKPRRSYLFRKPSFWSSYGNY